MLYADFLAIMVLLGAQMGYVLNGLDGVSMFTLPTGYSFSLLDMLLGAWISEELLVFMMEL